MCRNYLNIFNDIGFKSGLPFSDFFFMPYCYWLTGFSKAVSRCLIIQYFSGVQLRGLTGALENEGTVCKH